MVNIHGEGGGFEFLSTLVPLFLVSATVTLKEEESEHLSVNSKGCLGVVQYVHSQWYVQMCFLKFTSKRR